MNILDDGDPTRNRRRKVVEQVRVEQRGPLFTNLCEIGLSLRVVNALEQMGVITIGDLAVYPDDVIASSTSFGKKTAEELYQLLVKYGLRRAKP